jgi:antitoxin component YwqK of YwqJK toxin-antitoxin module
MKRSTGIAALTMVLAVICFAGYDYSYGRPIKVSASAEDKSDATHVTPHVPEVVKELFPNGKTKSETPFAGGKIHGKKKLYYENGSLQKEEEYREGRREGLSLEYYEDGTMKNHETYKDDKLNGDCFMNYPNGQKMMAGQCVDGNKSGKWTLFHNNGNKYMEGNYVEGVMEGLWRSFSPEGWLDSEGGYRNGSQADVWVFYDRYKKITKKITLKNGMIDGACWIYNQGRLVGEGIMTGQTHDPLKNGNWKAYYRNGRMKYEGVFVMGLRSGQFNEYYATGNIKGSGEYANNKRSGTWVFYSKDGITIDKTRSGQYINGKIKKP